MQLTGKHVLNAPVSIVWDLLMDTDTLARIVPGISKLEKIDDHSFKSTVFIKLGPVSSSFTGTLQMEDIQQQEAFTLKVQQNSKIGNASAAIKINMATIGENQAEVSFDGDIKLSGVLASMGQRVLGGVANTLSKQFFMNMEKEIAKQEGIPDDGI